MATIVVDPWPEPSNFGTPTVRLGAAFYGGAFYSGAFYAGTSGAGTTQAIYPVGFAAGAVGVPTLIPSQEVITYGSVYTLYGTPTVYNHNRVVRPFGMAPSNVFGTAFVADRVRTVAPVGVAPNNAFGNAWVSNFFRSVQTIGWDSSVVGAPRVVFALQRIIDAGCGSQAQYGTPSVSYRSRTLQPYGFDSSAFGTPVARDRAQQIRPVGLASAVAFGFVSVQYRTQRVFARGADSAEYGNTRAYNYRQILSPTGVAPGGFGPDTYAYNRNRRVSPLGFDASRFASTTLVINAARPVAPAGFVATAFGSARVSHRHRTIAVEGADVARYGFTTVRNASKVVSLEGWGFHSLVFPRPVRVWSNQQTIKPYSTTDQASYGRPRVSISPQVVRPVGILLPPEGRPTVSFRVRAIQPVGFVSYMGVPIVYSKFNVVKLWGYDHAELGVPSVRNVTPTIRPNSAVSFAAGRPTVQLMKRYVTNAGGIAPPDAGAPYVSFRRRVVKPTGVPPFLLGYPLVRFDASQQTPPVQRIDVVGFDDSVVPAPVLRFNQVAPPGWLSDAFGVVSVRLMSIVVDQPIDSVITLGTPTVLGGTKWVRGAGGSFDGALGTPRLIGPQLVDVGRIRIDFPPFWTEHDYHTYGGQDGGAQTVGPVFGAGTTVTNQHRTIRVSSALSDFLQFGTPRLSTRPQYIRPDGFLSYKRGLHVVLHAGQQVIKTMGHQDSVFGAARLVIPYTGPQTIYPQGIFEGAFGAVVVANFHRRIYPLGFDSFSSPLGAQYVGPPLRIHPVGFDSAEYGTPFVAYRIRTITQLPIVDDEPAQRFVVKHQARVYFIEGSDFGSFGTPRVTHRIQRIQPSGWEEFETGFSFVPQYYPGYSRLKTQTFIAAGSNEMTGYGHGTVSHS